MDEHVFIFNDQEKRVERLPYTVSGAMAPPVIKVFTINLNFRNEILTSFPPQPIAARVFDDLHNLSSGLNAPSLTVGRMNFKSRFADEMSIVVRERVKDFQLQICGGSEVGRAPRAAPVRIQQ